MKIAGNQAVVDSLHSFMQNMKKESEKSLGLENTSIQKQMDEIASGSATVLMAAKVRDDLIADQIAKRIARGESVTKEEKDKIRNIDAEKLRKAEEANDRRHELNRRLVRVKTKEEARAIIINEKLFAKHSFEKGDAQFGELLMEAVNKAELDYHTKNQLKPAKSVHELLENKEPSRLFDARL